MDNPNRAVLENAESKNNSVCSDSPSEVLEYTSAEATPNPVDCPDTVINSTEEPPVNDESSVGIGSLILKFVSGFFIMISVLVFAASAALIIKKTEMSLRRAAAFFLGEFVGGSDKISEVSEIPDEGDTVPPLHKDNEILSEDQNTSHDHLHTLVLPSLSNETPYSPDMAEILSMPRAIPTADELYAEHGSSAPLVLIIHTHATESFSNTANEGYRTEDTSKNIVAVGEVISESLRKEGIITIHCKELLDSKDFNMAYYNAAQKIREYITLYPSISYVLDIHRDYIELEDGTNYDPSINFGPVKAAQIMFVIGTDHGGSGHLGWRDNLALAARLNVAINKDYPMLMRNINLRSASFNEQYTKGSILVEIGASASSFESAVNSAEIFAKYLAKEIIG